LNSQNKQDTASSESVSSERTPSGYGGYATRHQYEQWRRDPKRAWKRAGIVSIVLALSFFAVVGFISVFWGNFFVSDPSGNQDGGSIRLPAGSGVSQEEADPKKLLSELNLSLITVEVNQIDHIVKYGSGFLLSQDGYAVCSASLFEKQYMIDTVYANTGGGITAQAELEALDFEMGIALIKLSDSYAYSPIPLGNSGFIQRGESLYIVGSEYEKKYYGTVLSGIAASVETYVLEGLSEKRTFSVIYVDVVPNSTLFGAAVMNEAGAVVGFCTDAIEAPFSGLSAVIPINTVYALVNQMLEAK